ncbi:helix-turn-helix protein [Lachnotalea glycerini]|uniref:Helix-turn-helix protein n=1 Tax=Lachnotalea glycerini TaxID=1763509 RepID=A0A318EJ80_9FIRM|nr:helix-turn-helix domain-containing protein [Lachnotalea glycerini]OYO76187.1 DNA-binding protein [Lachnotalea glycerini]PXV85128.1 helix-turn-helix protein [Lachnotalea glycerini]
MVEPYKPIYTAKEVSKMLHVSTNAVYEFMNNGQLPYLQLGSKKVRGIDLENFINTYPSGQEDKPCTD